MKLGALGKELLYKVKNFLLHRDLLSSFFFKTEQNLIRDIVNVDWNANKLRM